MVALLPARVEVNYSDIRQNAEIQVSAEYLLTVAKLVLEILLDLVTLALQHTDFYRRRSLSFRVI